LNLLKNSHTYLKAQKEVDDIVGKDSVQIHHLKDLKYLHAVLRETLRLFPTAPAMTKKVNPAVAHEPAILGGRYTVEPNEPIIVLLCKAQQDYAVYGEDAAEFKPERMLDEEFNKLPKGAWSVSVLLFIASPHPCVVNPIANRDQPFGNGVRACIGRAFAWQEALMVMAMILQNFDVQLDDPAYQLRIKQALTIKPKDLFIRVNLREGSPIDLDQKIHRNSPAADPKQQPKQATTTLNSTRVTRENMFVAYGSNTGTCQALAQRLASDAITDGFEPKVKDMDAMVDNIPKQCLIIFITSSYEGQAPDNAARFVEWLQASEEELDGVRFAVFGCGHSKYTTCDTRHEWHAD
jgi:cytochrome P450/NADPH-cytochrome P450 reductase